MAGTDRARDEARDGDGDGERNQHPSTPGTPFDISIHTGALFAILDLAGDAFLVVDTTGRVLVFNRAAERIFGWSADDVIGHSMEVLLPERFRSRHFLQMRDFRRGGQSPRLMGERREILGLRRNGSEFPAEASIAWVELDTGGTFVVVLRDITERHRAEQRTVQLGRIIEQSANEIYVFDSRSWKFLMVNRGARDNLGHSADELSTMTPLDLIPEFTADKFATLVRPLVDGSQDEVYLETIQQRRNGSTYEIEIRLQLLRAETPPVFVSFARDVTERTRFETLVRRQSYYDPLTLLPNRALLFERLGQTIEASVRDGTPGALMLIDLGDIKRVNDNLPGDVGDVLIQEAARRLEGGLRSRDTLARLGGGEFALMAPHLDPPASAAALATRLLTALEAPFDVGGFRTVIAPVIGITAFPKDGTDPHALVRNADAALWGARKDGVAGYRFFTADLNEAVKYRLAIKTGLATALERGEFHLVYQPKVDLATWRVCGVEALMRWNSPEMGMVPPSMFIPVLEETGLIGPAGDWVLETACRQRRLLREQGLPPVRMAVNLSVRQIRPEFIDVLSLVIARTGIAPSDLELEVTESLIMRDAESSIRLLRHMTDMGIHLSMDDFGCGYSSLSYLRRLPLDTIKIDRSFITDIATDPEDAEIVKAIIVMGHSLRRRIVAEGVETEQQLAHLKRLGCDEIQGYLFSPPVSAEELSRLLRAQASGEAHA